MLQFLGQRLALGQRLRERLLRGDAHVLGGGYH